MQSNSRAKHLTTKTERPARLPRTMYTFLQNAKHLALNMCNRGLCTCHAIQVGMMRQTPGCSGSHSCQRDRSSHFSVRALVCHLWA